MMTILTSKLLLLCFAGFISVACGQKKIVSENSVPDNIEITEHLASDPVEKETDYFAHLKPEHKQVLQSWLKTRSYLRPGVEEIDNSMFRRDAYEDNARYSENYDSNMKMLRETVGEGGYQYYSKADFNRDRKEDFAVLLVDNRKDKNSFTLAIFNAPFRKGQAPNYYEEGLSGITNSYIVFDKVSEKHLFLGKFESDVYCATYYPKGKTYRFEDCI